MKQIYTIKPLSQADLEQLQETIQFYQKLVRQLIWSILALVIIVTLLPHKAFSRTLEGYIVKFSVGIFPSLLLLFFIFGPQLKKIRKMQKDISNYEKQVFQTYIYAKKAGKKGQGGQFQLSNQKTIEVLQEDYEKYHLNEVIYIEQASHSGYIFLIKRADMS